MRLLLAILILEMITQSSAQNEEPRIREKIREFSKLLMEGSRAELLNLYTKDGKIFPTDREILEGNDLANYWNPEKTSTWRTSYHKITPVEIKILGNDAYDYGYYEETSTNGEESTNWKGKYVIIWRKEDGIWKIYLDIWNRIKL